MKRLKLTSKQWDALDDFRSSAREAMVYRNPTIILLSSAGNSKAQISYLPGCSMATVDTARRP